MGRLKVGIEVRSDSPFPIQVDYEGSDFSKIMASPELIPYPTQLHKPNLFVVADGNGAFKDVPYNRWGIVGNFAVVKMNTKANFVSMTQREREAVTKDLLTTRGYLDPACEVRCVFREPFAVHGEPPMGSVPEGGKWFADRRQGEMRQ